jgi:hypothetical protein
MSDKKKNKGRRAYLNDFVKSAGGYVYTGKIYKYKGSDFRKYRLTIVGLSLAICALTLLCGFIPLAGMDNCFYVIIPYVLEIAFRGSAVWALCRLIYHGSELREYVYSSTVKSIPTRLIVFSAATLLSIFAAIIYMCINSVFNLISVIALIAKMISILSALILRKVILTNDWLI